MIAEILDYPTAADLVCMDRTCKWFDPVSPHYTHDHEQMEEIFRVEEGRQ